MSGGRYELAAVQSEDHQEAIYCVAFNTVDKDYANYFATVSLRRASIWVLDEDNELDLLQVYEDENDRELYYVCTWSQGLDFEPLVAFGGETGLIQVINPLEQSLVHTLAGHGNLVNSIAVCPTQPNILASASRDATVRVWDAASGLLLFVLSGQGAHNGEVLSLAFHYSRNLLLATGGMDNSVKLWALERHYETMQEHKKALAPTVKPRAKLICRPVFSNICTHGNYIDCVRFAGDHLVTKSTDSLARVWRTDPPLAELLSHAYTKPLQRFVEVCDLPLEDSDQMWWVRLDISPDGRYLAAGSRHNHISVYDLHNPRQKSLLPSIANFDHSTRQVAVNLDAKVILAGTDHGGLFVWVQSTSEEKEDSSHVSSLSNSETNEDEAPPRKKVPRVLPNGKLHVEPRRFEVARAPTPESTATDL